MNRLFHGGMDMSRPIFIEPPFTVDYVSSLPFCTPEHERHIVQRLPRMCAGPKQLCPMLPLPYTFPFVRACDVQFLSNQERPGQTIAIAHICMRVLVPTLAMRAGIQRHHRAWMLHKLQLLPPRLRQDHHWQKREPAPFSYHDAAALHCVLNESPIHVLEWHRAETLNQANSWCHWGCCAGAQLHPMVQLALGLPSTVQFAAS